MASRNGIRNAVAALVAAALPSADVRGFEGSVSKPGKVGPDGTVLLRGLDVVDEDEPDLNPLTYNREARLDLLLLAQSHAKAEGMATALGTALIADRRLGGACEWADAEGASFDEETETGTAGQGEAAMTITASYQTTNPLD